MRVEVTSGVSTLREVFSLVWSQASGFVKGRLIAAMLLVTVASALTALGPVALKQVVDGFTSSKKGTAISAGAWICLYVLSQWLSRSVGEIRGLVYARAERRMSRTLSERLFEHILRLPLRFHLNRQTGAVTQSLTNGLQGYQTVLHTLVFSFLPVVAELATIVTVLAKLGPPVFLGLFSAAILCYAIVFRYAARQTMKAARSASAAQVAANGSMTDSILNYETIKYFAAESVVQERVGGELMTTEQQWVRFYRHFAVNGLLVATIYAAFLGTTILYATQEVQRGRISVGTFVLINTYMFQILRPVEMLGYAVQSLSQGVAYLEKMLELFRERTESQESRSPADLTCSPSCAEGMCGAGLSRSPRYGEGRDEGWSEAHPTAAVLLSPTLGARAADPTPTGDLRRLQLATGSTPPSRVASERKIGAGELEFRDVSLSYRSDRPVLRGVSFMLSAGRTLGIVGASGCGKSTIVRLLTRLLEPDGGTILLDGMPIQEWSLNELRGSIAVVPQDTVLFNDTIGYNIAFGRPGSSQDEVEKAARLAKLHDFILSLPEGYDTRVGERGVKLSGGERQRVSIARAALKRPKIYVADEATSSLDSKTEREIVLNLGEVAQNTTTVIIAHRLSTVVHAHGIVVLDAGVVAERGTHESLLRLNGRYAALWAAQHHGLVAA